MSEERLQEIKDSISLQYKVQEMNDLDSFNIFTDEEQELVDEIERLHSIIKEAIEYIQDRYNGEVLTHTFDKENVGELLNILKGSDSNE